MVNVTRHARAPTIEDFLRSAFVLLSRDGTPNDADEPRLDTNSAPRENVPTCLKSQASIFRVVSTLPPIRVAGSGNLSAVAAMVRVRLRTSIIIDEPKVPVAPGC